MSATNGVLPDPSEPDYTVHVFPPRSKANGAGMTSDSASAYAPEPWPMLAPAAYHGLAGEVVAMILPHTESDPVALLLQYLASFGSVNGRTRYYQAEATQHFGNLFVTLWATPRRRARAPPPSAFARSSRPSSRPGPVSG
jgi:hypothetical protein